MVTATNFPTEAPLGSSNTSFGTDGIRGRVNTVLTPSIAKQVGFWSGQVLIGDGPVVIGKDSRVSGDMLTAALTAGLNAAGKEVWNIGLCPTPAIPFIIRKLNATGGLMISASHNPPEDNGIKIFNTNGVKLNSEQQKTIELGLRGQIIKGDFHTETQSFGKSFQRPELLNHYTNNHLENFQGASFKGIPIVLDLCWGSATACSAKVFEALGADLTILHGEPIGERINLKCGSTDLSLLKKAVLEKKAEMGFAFDGDADRVLAIDRQGRIVDGDHILFLLGSHLQERDALPNNMIVATVMSNLGFERSWIDRGGVLKRTPVGDQHVHEAMIQTGSALGGEQSGHILMADNQLCGDGLLTALKIATLCKERKQSLADWMNKSFKPYPQKLVNISIPDNQVRKEWKDCEPFHEAISNAETAMGNHGRVLVRASGTEPLLRVMVEASDPKAVESWTNQLANLAEEHLNAA